MATDKKRKTIFNDSHRREMKGKLPGMTNEKYIDDILQFLKENESNHPPRLKKLARRMGISDDDYGDFRAAYKRLRDEGRIVMGAENALTLPMAAETITGRFSANQRGFGFVSPSDSLGRSDLFIPPDKTGGAMNGDMVVARVIRQGKRDGEMRMAGEVIEIKERGITRAVGTLQISGDTWFVMPEGTSGDKPVVIRDVPVEHRIPGTKVVAQIIWYPTGRGFPEGVLSEVIGRTGEPAVEIRAVMIAHRMVQDFSPQAVAEAEAVAAAFDPENAPNREDLTGTTIVTIDPVTARDYDDAISIEVLDNGRIRLGVHIADVAHFVRPGGALDAEAYERGTSVYFPRHVVPMLPGLLSNGVCSLQEGVKRFTKSAFIDYDNDGEIIESRLAETVICSAKRLTYEEAQGIIEGKKEGYSAKVVSLVQRMNDLAKIIEKRRTRDGMLHLALPEIELLLDDDGKVTDAHPTDTSYTHTIIEMFMVEANEALARFFFEKDIPIIRRIHPLPDEESMADLGKFTAACGYPLSKHPTHAELQQLVADVADKPESYAVNLALLRSFQRAVYSIEPLPHFALAGDHYAHFTSPIRRYPDLTLHRAVADYLSGRLKKGDRSMEGKLAESATYLSTRERAAQAAEQELRLVLILGYLADKKGETFEGIITGVTDFGVFVQSPKFLIEGLIRLQDLGDDWWNVSSELGKIRGEMSGKVYRIGSKIEVRIDHVDIPRRRLDLSLTSVPRRTPEKEDVDPLRIDTPRTDTYRPTKKPTDKRPAGFSGRRRGRDTAAAGPQKTGRFGRSRRSTKK